MKREDYKHWIIPALSILWIVICFAIDVIWKQTILGETLPGHGGTRGDFAQNPYGPLSPILLTLRHFLLFYYIYLSLRYYSKYRNYIVSELSIADEVDFRWVRNILYTFTIAITFWFIFDLASMVFDYDYDTVWWGYLFWGITIFYITICGYKDDSHINNQIAFDPNKAVVLIEPEVLQEADHNQSIPLRQIMEQNKSYLKPNLNLNDFAKELRIAPSQLSKILNNEFNQNFNEFVNQFRIHEVVKKLKQEAYSHYSILGIALECGFNSKATFNRVFKIQMGMSPSEYRKNVSSKKS